MKPVARLCLLLATAPLVFACGGDKTTDGPAGSGGKTLKEIRIQSNMDTLPVGRTDEWLVMGVYSDNSEENLTDKVEWVTSNEAVATISELTDGPGLLIASSEGRAIISAVYGELTVNQWVTVEPAVAASVAIEPGGLTVGIGKNIILKSFAQLTDDTRIDVTRDVTWASSNVDVGLMSATDPGYMVTRAKGTTTITAEYQGKSISVDFTITDATVDRIVLTPDAPRVESGASALMSATGHYTDNTQQNITRRAQWLSSAPGVATVSASGVVTGVSSGNADITARFDGKEATVAVRVWTPGQCDYPMAGADVVLNETMPPLFWDAGLLEDGTEVDFRMDQFHCASQWAQYETAVFVVGAGWCPYCPDYMREVNNQAAELEAAGMLIIYMQIETSSRQPASNQQAFDIVRREIPKGPGLRLGDGATQPQSGVFGRAITAIPHAFVLRKSDMKIIAAGRPPLVDIARNPDRY